MPAIMAFLHHLAAFVLFSSITIEFLLLRDAISLENARRLLRVDGVYGASAGLLLALGLLRVFYFEKGVDYYFSNSAFLIKLSLFFVIGLLSIYPTLEFLRWRKAIKLHQVPVLSEHKLRRLRLVLHLELMVLLLIVFCAALMAKGIG